MSLLLITIIGLSCKTIMFSQPKQFIKPKEPEIVGIYHFVRDSVDTPNPHFYESIEFRSDSSFVYFTRQNEFIKINIQGRWRIEGKEILLNSDNQQKTVVKPEKCRKKPLNYYHIIVRDNNGSNFNYNLKTTTLLLNDLNGEALLKKRGQSYFQIISSSGFHSERMQLNPKYSCYQVSFANKRQFINERWEVFKDKIRPRGIDFELAKYFLYKKINQ